MPSEPRVPVGGRRWGITVRTLLAEVVAELGHEDGDIAYERDARRSCS